MISLLKKILPKMILNYLKKIKNKHITNKGEITIKDYVFVGKSKHQLNVSAAQDLDIYWDSKMAEILETWGEGNVWNEIQYLMVALNGRVLDIACGTGKTMEILSKFSMLEIHGCDISDLLIKKANSRGIEKARLKVGDATNMDYERIFFDYAYSIGSLEHFTEDGIVSLLKECKRVTKNASFHNIPVSRSNKDEGWIKRTQSYYNNSIDWWMDKFNQVYKKVYIIDSAWNDSRSVGKWFICINS